MADEQWQETKAETVAKYFEEWSRHIQWARRQDMPDAIWQDEDGRLVVAQFKFYRSQVHETLLREAKPAEKVSIERPFGWLVMRVLALARPTKIETSALALTIEDTRHEINEALAAGRDEQVRRLKFRGWLLLVWMVILELASAAAAIRRLIG